MSYIDREKAFDAVFGQFCASSDETEAALNAAIEEIRAIPAADVRPVVSCCDCQHFQVNVSPSGYLPQGVPEWECRYWCRPTGPTDFCSYGEKMEES